MPIDRDSKTLSDSQGARGLLSKCTTLFKQKRALSRRPQKKVSLQMEKPKVNDVMAEVAANVEPGAIFTAFLENSEEYEKHNKKHKTLIDEEDTAAWDRNARSPNDPNEQRAVAIIHAIREYERNNTFGNKPSEAIPGPETRDMGGQFLTNKDRIENDSKLYEIAKEVPKGALLHLHFNAELHPERLLEQARFTKNMYIRSTRPLITQKDLDLTEMVFNVIDPNKVEPNVNIFSPDYPGDATNWKQDAWMWKVWMSWESFQKEFDERKVKFSPEYWKEDHKVVQGPQSCSEPGHMILGPAEKWLKMKMVLSEDEAYSPDQTVNGVWARFNQATRCFKGLLNYKSVYEWYIGEAIDRMIEEKVMYAELRPMLLDKFIPDDSGLDERKLDRHAQMKLIKDGVERKKAELKEKGESDKFPFGLKIIYCTPRSIPNSMMREEMKTCIELKLKYRDLICGFDLVGAEDRKNHIGHYRKELVAFRQTCEKLDLDIPFMFHAGETLLDTGGSSDPKNSNLYDAVILKSKRIGHGFALMKHPHLIKEFQKTEKQDGICIELCPISNELLHLCRNIKEHPFPELLAAGIPCTVNSDNPSLFSNSMSHEFYQVMVGAPTMSLYSWKQLALWSIEYSCLSKKEKIKGYEIFDRDWKKFCEGVVKQYGGLLTGDTINEETMTKDLYKKSSQREVKK